jgi:hypothetical protein
MTTDNLPWLILGASVLFYGWVIFTQQTCTCGHEEGSHIDLQNETPVCLGGGDSLCRCRGFKKG